MKIKLNKENIIKPVKNKINKNKVKPQKHF